MANHVHAHRYVIFYLLSVFPSHLRLLNGQAKVALYTVIMLQPCSVVCGKYLQAIPMYIQAIGTRHVNSTYSKRITSHIPTSLLVGSLPLAHNAEHFTSILQWYGVASVPGLPRYAFTLRFNFAGEGTF